MDTARVSSKGQVTIPHRVRSLANIREGDLLMFTFDGSRRVVIERVDRHEADELDALSATFHEWGEEEDDRAFQDL